MNLYFKRCLERNVEVLSFSIYINFFSFLSKITFMTTFPYMYTLYIPRC